MNKDILENTIVFSVPAEEVEDAVNVTTHYGVKEVFRITPEMKLEFGPEVTPKDAARAIEKAFAQLITDRLSK